MNPDNPFREQTSDEFYNEQYQRILEDIGGEMTDCTHEDFDASVEIVKIVEGKPYAMADVSIWCSSCGIRLKFVGFRKGISMGSARVSLEETELRVPLALAAPTKGNKK